MGRLSNWGRRAVGGLLVIALLPVPGTAAWSATGAHSMAITCSSTSEEVGEPHVSKV